MLKKIIELFGHLLRDPTTVFNPKVFTVSTCVKQHEIYFLPFRPLFPTDTAPRSLIKCQVLQHLCHGKGREKVLAGTEF